MRQQLAQSYRPEIPHISAHIELPRQRLQSAVAVPVQIDAAAIHTLPAAERIMAEHEVDLGDPQFGIMGNALPILGLRHRIVVAEDQVLSSVEPGQDLGRKSGGTGEISDVPHLVFGADNRVPTLDHCGIHLRDRAKRPRIKVQHPVVAEVGVADEKDAHLLIRS